MHFLTLAYTVLQWIGVFISRDWSKWKSRAYKFYRTMIFVITALITVLMTIQMFVAPDLTILARTIDLWSLFLSGLFKWFCMSLFHEEFANLKTRLFEIQAQGSVAYGHSRSADQFTINYLKPTRNISYLYLSSGVVVCAFLVLSPLVTYPKGDRSNFEYYNDPKSYPISCWMPFIVDERWMFWTIFVSHSISLVIIGSMYLGIDSFMFSAMYAIGGQIELLTSSINRIENSLGEMERSSVTNQLTRYTEKQQIQCYSILRDCVKHHIMILDYIKRVRTLFSLLIIMDYLHGITSLSFALFQTTISDGVGETISIVSFIVVSVWHQFLNNFFGEFIIQKQLSVSVAVYQIPWGRTDKSVRRLLNLVVLRSIRPTIITGFYMYKLSYASFISFVKALYTYYMVLRRVNIENKN